MPIFELTRDALSAVPRTTMQEQLFREREDLQRLLKGSISALGEELFIIAEEFSEWQDSKRRVDLLALDRSGALVVIELKRTEDGGHMELQAIRYAAMISTMSFQQTVAAHAGFLGCEGTEAEAAILDFLGVAEVPDNFGQRVRIVLVSADFSRELTICNNLQDVERAADLIEQSLKEMGSEVKRKDFIAKPVFTGYRAIHLLTHIPITVGPVSLSVGCEVQIRTLLQDAWAKLSRADLYRSNIPKQLLKQFAAMSQSLADADALADQVRVEITRPVPGKKPDIDATISESSLAFIYQRAFKEEPPSYLVEWMLKKIADAEVRADALDAVFQDQAFFKQCQSEYQQAAKWPADPSRQLEWAIESLLQGPKRALALAREHGQRDWDEIDAEYQREVRSQIPDTWEDFERDMNAGNLDFLELARYFDVVRSCICGEEMIEFDDLIDAVFDFYSLREKERHAAYDDLLGALNDSGIEDADGSSLCSYHHHMMEKDD